MVSKVAVIALVAIMAVPILLGYALNLNEVTETDYRATNDNVNVTNLLQNGTNYNDVNADIYQINRYFDSTLSQNQDNNILPIYNTVGFKTTSFPMNRYLYDGIERPSSTVPWDQSFNTYSYVFFNIVKPIDTGYLILRIIDNDDSSIFDTTQRMKSFYYDSQTNVIEISYFTSTPLNVNNVAYKKVTLPDANYKYQCTASGSYDSIAYIERARLPDYKSVEPWNYVDLSGGYHFEGSMYNIIKLPEKTKSYLMTINLDTITSNDYYRLMINSQGIGLTTLEKTTTDGVVSWTGAFGSDYFNIYYDPNRSDNTYQLYFSANVNQSISGTDYVDLHTDLRYVGGWPTTIGAAQSYITYTNDREITTSTPFTGISEIQLMFTSSDQKQTPTIRMDAATFSGTEYPVISDNVYNPATFKQYPSTTITNITQYGKSLTFGGNTYNVSNGNITLGTHELPVKDLVFSSRPNTELGGYDNMIGNTVISNSAEPSTITFGGMWAASVDTKSMESYTYTKTVWNAGEFGWDGIDQNFLIVGLLTCLGVFVALGIYARKKGSGGIIPLMIVTGCAAAVFFIML